MSLFNIFEISGSAMSAQSTRLNTTASNIANAESVSSSINETYRARHPVFSAVFDASRGRQLEGAGVEVLGVVESQATPRVKYEPENPMADAEGNVYLPNVNVVEEMANMISSSRNYQVNVQIANTTKTLLQRTLSLGQ
ncbi:flagellar basal body rod protein FlgC [Pleionea sp. CnH1-48]|uniref:flagellar basal body rod protein FlgC n=1 Tax=Pleionea sp. CnH1-48 TaxID=2954494 RepID=UPI0020979123|nr:flagellar basal body rod protein FlgC [Pleionea sp. CnH1-48]MCO7226160.1 flagellar basal body rod protein FlgC [Pleionea sp. CnH1-48]